MGSGGCWSRCSTRPASGAANDRRTVVDVMLYIAQTGCQWRYLPESFEPWTRVAAVPALVTQRHLGSH
jgi:transposase